MHVYTLHSVYTSDPSIPFSLTIHLYIHQSHFPSCVHLESDIMPQNLTVFFCFVSFTDKKWIKVISLEFSNSLTIPVVQISAAAPSTTPYFPSM